MAISIKVNNKTYNRVVSYSNCGGLLEGLPDCWVYAELGEESEYINKAKDDPNTDFRIFKGCIVWACRSKEDLKARVGVEPPLTNQTVKIYY